VQCGATVVDEIVDAEALVAGPGIARGDLREAAGLRIAILRTTDVTLIATTRRRLDRQRELAYRESVGRALADARRLVAQRDRRVAAGITEPVAPGRGLHIRGGSDDSA
jgi:hypothetical protein